MNTSRTVEGPLGFSSGDNALYACVQGGAALLNMRSLTGGLGFEFGSHSAVAHRLISCPRIASRRGLGRQRQVSTRFLFIQDKVNGGELRRTTANTTY